MAVSKIKEYNGFELLKVNSSFQIYNEEDFCLASYSCKDESIKEFDRLSGYSINKLYEEDKQLYKKLENRYRTLLEKDNCTFEELEEREFLLEELMYWDH